MTISRVIVPKSEIVGSPEWAAAKTDALKQAHQFAERDISLMAEHAAEVKTNRIWEVVFDDEPKTWQRYCAERLELASDYIDNLMIVVETLRKRGHAGPIPGKYMQDGLRDGPGNPTGINQHTDRNYYNYNNSCGESVSQGTSDDYLRARLKRDDPKRYDMLLTGQYRSARAAAIDAGIIDPEKTKRYQLPTDPTKAGKYLAERVDAEWMLACYDAFMKASE